jgi:hypothetical protein
MAFDFLELSPGFFRKFFCQRFNIPAAAGRIDRLNKVEFMLFHDLDITGNTAGKYITGTNAMIKRFDIHAVHTANNRREGLCCRTQQIYIRIVFRLAEGRSADIKIDLLCFFIPTAIFNDLRPNHFQTAQFSNFHKEISSDTEMKTQVTTEGIDINTTAFHSAHISYSFIHSIRYFLNVVSTAIMINIGIDNYCFKLRRIFFSPGNTMCHFVIIFIQRTN